MELIKNTGKYHYLIANSKKALLLSSNNSKNEARKEALSNIKPIIDKVKGKDILLLTIRKISEKRLKSQEDDDIQLLGGPIQITIEKIKVISENKLKNLGGSKNNKAYFTQKFVDKNNIIDTKYLTEIAYNYFNNSNWKSGPFDVNIVK